MLDLQQSKYLGVQEAHRQGLGQLFLTVPAPKCIVTTRKQREEREERSLCSCTQSHLHLHFAF